jgi:hypothetical protein
LIGADSSTRFRGTDCGSLSPPVWPNRSATSCGAAFRGGRAVGVDQNSKEDAGEDHRLEIDVDADEDHARLDSAFGAIWVVNHGAIQRIYPATNDVVATIETGLDGEYSDITSGGGFVWVCFDEAPVVQIDPDTNAIVRMYKGSGLGESIRYGAGSSGFLI